MRTDIMVLTERNISHIAKQAGRSISDVEEMLRKAEAIGHRCIFAKSETDELWTYTLIRKPVRRPRLPVRV